MVLVCTHTQCSLAAMQKRRAWRQLSFSLSYLRLTCCTGRVGIYQTDNFAELRENNEEVNMAAQHLENLLRKQVRSSKRSRSMWRHK